MPSVAQTARLLRRYGDFLGIFAVIPLISQVKFGRLVPQKGGAVKAQSEPGCLPPAWTLLLIFLAEVCGASQLFSSSDRQVQRAVGEAMRAQHRSKTSMVEVLAAAERLLGHEDVYTVTRFVGAFCGCGGLFLSAFVGLDKLPSMAGSPLGMARQSVGHVLRNACQPRLLCILALLAAFAVGHASPLSQLLRKPALAELAYALPGLLRALGLTGMAMAPQRADLLPTYSAVNACVALARQAHILVYERASVTRLLQGEFLDAKAEIAGPWAAISLELWSVLMLLPAALSKGRFLLIVPVLALPCALLALDSPKLTLIEPYIEMITHRITFSTAVMSLFILFMGGFQTMSLAIVLFQVWNYIYKLDKLKF